MRRLATCDRHRPAPRLTWQSGQALQESALYPISVRIYAARGAAFTLSGVNGTERRRTPGSISEKGDAAALPFAAGLVDFIVCRSAIKNFSAPDGQ